MMINDLQEMKLMELAAESVETYNGLIHEKAEKVQSLIDVCDKIIERQKKETVAMCTGLLSIYEDKSNTLVIDCTDNLDKDKTYITTDKHHSPTQTNTEGNRNGK